jgi:hypothetical protein
VLLLLLGWLLIAQCVARFALCISTWQALGTSSHQALQTTASENPGIAHHALTRGAPKEKKKMKRGYIWQMANKSGRLKVGTFLFFLNFFKFFYGVFVRFSTRGVQKRHKKLFGESLCQKLLAGKVDKKKLFSFHLFPFPIEIIFIAFLAVSLHEEPKNTPKIFSKTRPENLKKSQKR